MIDGLNLDINHQELEYLMGWELTDEQLEKLERSIWESIHSELIDFQNKNNL